MNTRPCWLCAQPNTVEEAQCGDEYKCSRCGVSLDYFLPLRVPLTGASFLWTRPDSTDVRNVIHAAEVWQGAAMWAESVAEYEAEEEP